MGAPSPHSIPDRTRREVVPGPRSVPPTWGEWPPSARRIRQIAERAARCLARRLAIQERDGPGLVLLVVPYEPDELDLCYAPTAEYATIARVLAIGRAQAWFVYWNPTIDAGLVRRTFDHTV